MRAALGPAELAAAAARDNAQAVIDAERAHFLVGIKSSNMSEPLFLAEMYDKSPGMNPSPVARPRVEYVLSNAGKTVGLLKSVRHGLIWEAKGEARKFASRPYGPLETIRAGEDSKTIACEFEGDFTFKDAREIVSGAKALLFSVRPNSSMPSTRCGQFAGNIAVAVAISNWSVTMNRHPVNSCGRAAEPCGSNGLRPRSACRQKPSNGNLCPRAARRPPAICAGPRPSCQTRL